MKQLKDYLHLYLGCEVKHQDNEILTNRLESISIEGLIGDETRDDSGEGWYSLEEVKPILRPLSSMTEKEKLEHYSASKNNPSKNIIIHDADQTIYLLSKHFDLFGLIDAGLAIDKTAVKKIEYCSCVGGLEKPTSENSYECFNCGKEIKQL